MSFIMQRAILSLALFSLGPCLTVAWRHGNQGRGYPVYGGHSAHQPQLTATVTSTEVSTVTASESSCNVIYIPTTVTVYTSCPAASVPGVPISSNSNHATWPNATSVSNSPCTDDSPTSIGSWTTTLHLTEPTAPGSVSSSLGWNHTSVSFRPTLTGTAITTIESADPIGTSSVFWRNSTQPPTTEKDLTTVITRTVTSSAVVTISATLTSGNNGPTAPNSGHGTGTGLPKNSSTTLSSYQPSLTYRTTLLTPTSSVSHFTTKNATTTKASVSLTTKSWTLPPGWSVSSLSKSATTSTATIFSNSSILSSISVTPKASSTLSSASIITTESNDPIFTTTSTPPTLTSPINTTTPKNNMSTITTATTTPHNPSLPISSTTEPGNGGGEEYGSYIYPASSLSASSPSAGSTSTEVVSSVESADPIGGTTTGAGTSASARPQTWSTTFWTETRTVTTSSASMPGGGGYGVGYGYGGYEY